MAQSETRTYSVEDLSAGMNTLHQNAERNRQWVTSVAESVHWNAELMNKLIERVNGIDTGMNMVATKVDELAVNMQTKLEEVHSKDIQRDNTLREELNAMAAKLASVHDDLQTHMARVQAAPEIPPGLILRP